MKAAPPAVKRAVLTHFGFQRTTDGARLTVRTSPAVAFTVRDASPTRVILELDQTQISLANNRLPLDTHYFGTAVTRIVPHEDAATGRVRIEVELSAAVAHEAQAVNGAIVIDFGGADRALTQASDATTGSR